MEKRKFYPLWEIVGWGHRTGKTKTLDRLLTRCLSFPRKFPQINDDDTIKNNEGVKRAQSISYYDEVYHVPPSFPFALDTKTSSQAFSDPLKRLSQETHEIESHNVHLMHLTMFLPSDLSQLVCSYIFPTETHNTVFVLDNTRIDHKFVQSYTNVTRFVTIDLEAECDRWNCGSRRRHYNYNVDTQTIPNFIVLLPCAFSGRRVSRLRFLWTSYYPFLKHVPAFLSFDHFTSMIESLSKTNDGTSNVSDVMIIYFPQGGAFCDANVFKFEVDHRNT